MIHPRKYEEYGLGVLVDPRQARSEIGLVGEVSMAPAKKDKGWVGGGGLGWWCIPERVKSLGSGCGLEVHLEIWGFFPGRTCRKQSTLCWVDSGLGGQVLIHSDGFKSQSYHLPAEPSQIICITSKYFLSYTVVITVPYTTSSYED